MLMAWVFLKQKHHSRKFLTIIWASIIVILSSFVTIMWATTYSEISLLGAIFLFNSMVLLSGPFLIWTVGKKWNVIWSVLAVLVLVPISFYSCLFLLFHTDQIWI